MLTLYLILLFLYIGLTVLFTLSHSKPFSLKPWSLLPAVPLESVVPLTCNVDTDCPSSHICLANTCLPKLLRGGRCDSTTGQWISFSIKGKAFAICSCLDSTLFSQRYFGGNCDVSVACGTHGQYNPLIQRCDCDPGYKAVNLTCQREPVLEQIKVCGPDEIQVNKLNLDREGFHSGYLARLQPARCVKRPCSFDALSGRPLKQAKYEPGWGCVCDPTYGYFGVTLNGQNKRYLASEGFDACASIFLRDPATPIDVQSITYFYLGQREPISILLFPNLRQEDLVPLLRGQGHSVMITQTPWRYDFAQHFFKHTPRFRAMTRYVRYMVWSGYTPFSGTVHPEITYQNDTLLTSCSRINRYFQYIHQKGAFNHQDAYTLLYKDLVCSIPHFDLQYPLFQDRVILNPFHLTFEEHEDVARFNAFALKYNREKGVLYKRWTLDLDYEYEVDRYRIMDTNAPQWA